MSATEPSRRIKVLYFLSVAVIIGVAVILRSMGYFDGSISLWLDEAYWADRLMTQPLKEVVAIRPIGYMWLTKVMLSISNNEIVLRLLSYASSIAALPLCLLIARRAWKSKFAHLYLLLMVAVSPVLVAFAKEFKPYALGFFMHACLLYMTLVYVESKQRWLLYAILLFSVLSVYFSLSIVFLFPAVFLLLTYEAYKKKSAVEAVAVAIGAAMVFLQLFLMYLYIWSANNLDKQEAYWGNKYDVFYAGQGFFEKLEWLAVKYYELVNFSSNISTALYGYPNVKLILSVVFVVLHLIGIASFIHKKNYTHLLLFFAPIALVVFVNVIGYWPFGPFRTNIFLLLYFSIVTVIGIKSLAECKYKLIRIMTIATTIVVAFGSFSMFVYRHDYTVKPYYSGAMQSNVREAIEFIVDNEKLTLSASKFRAEEVKVIAGWHAYVSLKHYLEHDSRSYIYNDFFQKNNIHLENVDVKALIPALRNLEFLPNGRGRDMWFVLEEPYWINQLELILNQVPDRVLCVKKFSYGTIAVKMKV